MSRMMDTNDWGDWLVSHLGHKVEGMRLEPLPLLDFSDAAAALKVMGETAEPLADMLARLAIPPITAVIKLGIEPAPE